MVGIVANVAIGIVSGMLAATTYAFILSRCKPKVLLSDKIMFGSKAVRYGDEQVGIIKIAHKNKKPIINIEVVMHYLIPDEKGYWYKDIIVIPMNEIPTMLPGYKDDNKKLCEFWIKYDCLRDHDLKNGAKFYVVVSFDYNVLDSTRSYTLQQEYSKESFTRDIFKGGYTTETISI